MLTISSFKLRLLVWCLSVFSTFFTIIKVYPAFFLLFILSHVAFISRREFNISSGVFIKIVFVICVVSVFLLASIKGLIVSNSISWQDNIKLVINYAFLAASLHFFTANKEALYSNRYTISRLLTLLLILSFFQLLRNIHAVDFWFVPFDGSNTSSMISYKLTEPGVLFGDLNKNIWSTKVIFISIILLVILFKGYIKYSSFGILIITLMITFVVVYSLSRTGQFVFVSFIGMSTLWYIVSKTKTPLSKIFFVMLFFGVLSILIFTFSGYIMRIDVSDIRGDGLAARILIWNSFIQNIDIVEFVGHGVNSAQHFISGFTGRSENNFHNVLLNILYEAGIIGLFFFMIMLSNVFFYIKKSRINFWLSATLFAPLFICINSHYVGYDADLVIYMVNSAIVSVLDTYYR